MGKKKLYIMLSYRSFLVLLLALTIASPFLWYSSRPATDFSAGNYFSFFTVQSNLLGFLWMTASVVLLLVNLFSPREVPLLEDRVFASVVRGGVLLYLLVTMIIYQAVLRGSAAGNFVSQARNWLFHAIFPIAFFADWLVDPGEPLLPWTSMFYWLVYPFLYAVYTLTRGAVVHWYPYFFIDAAENGYGMVLVGCLVLLACFVALGSLVIFLHRWRKGLYKRLNGVTSD